MLTADAWSRWVWMPADLRARTLGLTLLGVGSAVMLVWGSASDASAGRALLATLLAASAGAAAVIWIGLERRFEHSPLWWVLGLALLLRVIAIQASPLLEDDHFRYLWDGLRTATTFDPYRLPPSAFFGHELPPHWQDVLSGINNPDIPTIYGPLLQWLFALAYWIAPGRIEPIQWLLLMADMAVVGLLARYGVGRRWLLVYAVHPLILKEAMAGAHPDGLVALLLLLALLAWRRQLALWVGVLIGLAVGAKVAALVALPLLCFAPLERQRGGLPPRQTPAWALRVGVGMVVVLVLLYLPFVWNGSSDAVALGVFGSQWRFNPLLFRVIEALLPSSTARVVAALLIAAGIGAIAWVWRHPQRPTSDPRLPPLDAVLVLLLVLSPVVNPWYWLWALALSVFLRRAWVVAVGVTAVLSYLNTTVLAQAFAWDAGGTAAPYSVAWPLAAVQLLVLVAAAPFRSRPR